MKPDLVLTLALIASSAPAAAQYRDVDPRDGTVSRVSEREETNPWATGARFFAGVGTGMGIAPGGKGPSPSVGLEVGVAADSGIGFGLSLVYTDNPADVPALRIPKAQYALGAAADIRWYIQTVEPLTLYPALSIGFLAGPSVNEANGNAVMPIINPGFGARVRMKPLYVSFEFGAAGFHIPYVGISVGYEPDRKPAAGRPAM